MNIQNFAVTRAEARGNGEPVLLSRIRVPYDENDTDAEIRLFNMLKTIENMDSADIPIVDNLGRAWGKVTDIQVVALAKLGIELRGWLSIPPDSLLWPLIPAGERLRFSPDISFARSIHFKDKNGPIDLNAFIIQNEIKANEYIDPVMAAKPPRGPVFEEPKRRPPGPSKKHIASVKAAVRAQYVKK